jgi:hypothetical protein
MAVLRAAITLRLVAFAGLAAYGSSQGSHDWIGGHGALPINWCCRMGRGFAAGTVFIATPARSQSCDLGSIVNDFGNIGDALTGPACDQAYGDSAALTVAASALGGLLAADPSAGKSLCGDVQNLFSNGQSAANINQLVNNYFGSGIGPGSELIGALSQVAGPLATLSCACSIDQGVGQIANNIGSCFEAAVCAGIQLIKADIRDSLATVRIRCRSPVTIARRRSSAPRQRMRMIRNAPTPSTKASPKIPRTTRSAGIIFSMTVTAGTARATGAPRSISVLARVP